MSSEHGTEKLGIFWLSASAQRSYSLVAFHYSSADVFDVIPVFFGLLISVISTAFTVASVHLRLGGLVPAATAALTLSVVGVSLIGKTTLALAALPMGGLVSGNPFKDVDVTQPLLGYEPDPDSAFGLGRSLVAAILVGLSLCEYLKIRLGKEK